jgi:hypothetical protein
MCCDRKIDYDEYAWKDMNTIALSRHPSARCIKAALAASILWWASASAQINMAPGYPDSVEGYDRREVAMLPRYCLSTLGFRLANVPGSQDQAVTDRWYAYLGPSFNNLHHYCWGLMKTNRAMLLARDVTTRNFYLRDANKEFDYVIGKAPDDFLLLPEILTKRAENLARIGTSAVGVPDLERAISLKSDYWPAYAALSDHYKANADTAKAREVLEEGLAKSPDAVGLQRRLTELAGTPRKPGGISSTPR